MGNRTSNKTAVRFVLLFLLAYGFLYTINYALTGILQPGGVYSLWLDDHLDYITAFRAFLLSCTATTIDFFGYDTFLKGDTLFVKDGHSIRIIYSCIGINILCVWWAFVIALPIHIKRKAFHFIVGTIGLIALNITRLCMLTMSSKDHSLGQLVVDHHTIYNCVVYGLILIAIQQVIDRQLSP